MSASGSGGILLTFTGNPVHLSILSGLLLFILAMAVIFAPLFGVYYLVRFIWNAVEAPLRSSAISYPVADSLLSAKFPYYAELKAGEKTRFLQRLSHFMASKEFSGAGGLQITDEMRVLISASAIQLTFGLEDYLMGNFSRIVVYPKEFYSRIGKQYHKGETNLAGIIVLSWNHFMEGYSKPDDNRNLGLHEMAHALRFGKFKNENYDTFFAGYFEKWQAVSREEYMNLRKDKPSFLRSYAGTNIHEFFSVCVEYFFESPEAFREAHPEVYQHLCVLLCQDPLKKISGPLYSAQQAAFRELDDTLIHETRLSAKYMLSLIFAGGFWLYLTSVHSDEHINVEAAVWLAIMPVAGYFIILFAFRKACFYGNGIRIRHLVPSIGKKEWKFSYDDIISVEFSSGNYSLAASDSLKITYKCGGRICTSEFSDSLDESDLSRLSAVLQEKKILVKINSYVR